MNYSHFCRSWCRKKHFRCIIDVLWWKRVVSQFFWQHSGENLVLAGLDGQSSTLFIRNPVLCRKYGQLRHGIVSITVSMGFSLALVCPLTIKKSIGLQRGKNDRIDAKRIANYAVLHNRKLKLYKLPDKELVKLRGGIGVINTIVFDNFQRFDNPRKFACYCGVPHLNILQVFPYEEKHRHLH